MELADLLFDESEISHETVRSGNRQSPAACSGACATPVIQSNIPVGSKLV